MPKANKIGFVLTVPANGSLSVHGRAEERRDSGEESEDETEADEQLAVRDGIAPEGRMRQHGVAEEKPVPALDVRVCALRLLERSVDPDREKCAGFRAGPRLSLDFIETFAEPLPAHVDAEDQPDPGESAYLRTARARWADPRCDGRQQGMMISSSAERVVMVCFGT